MGRLTTRITLGYAEDRIMQLLHASTGPLDADDIAKARRLRTSRGTHVQLRNLELRGLIEVAVPALGGPGGHKARYGVRA